MKNPTTMYPTQYISIEYDSSMLLYMLKYIFDNRTSTGKSDLNLISYTDFKYADKTNYLTGITHFSPLGRQEIGYAYGSLKNGERGKEHLPPDPSYKMSWEPVIGAGLVVICTVGIIAIAADDLTGVGVADDFLFGPLGAGVGEGLIMIFG